MVSNVDQLELKSEVRVNSFLHLCFDTANWEVSKPGTNSAEPTFPEIQRRLGPFLSCSSRGSPLLYLPLHFEAPSNLPPLAPDLQPRPFCFYAFRVAVKELKS